MTVSRSAENQITFERADRIIILKAIKNGEVSDLITKNYPVDNLSIAQTQVVLSGIKFLATIGKGNNISNGQMAFSTASDVDLGAACSYYTTRCQNNGGAYYCDVAPKVCAGTPDSAWTRCVRSCLQQKDVDCAPTDRCTNSGTDVSCQVRIHSECWTSCI